MKWECRVSENIEFFFGVEWSSSEHSSETQLLLSCQKHWKTLLDKPVFQFTAVAKSKNRWKTVKSVPFQQNYACEAKLEFHLSENQWVSSEPEILKSEWSQSVEWVKNHDFSQKWVKLEWITRVNSSEIKCHTHSSDSWVDELKNKFETGFMVFDHFSSCALRQFSMRLNKCWWWRPQQ